MRPWSSELVGRIDEHVFTSELLRGNPLNDPYERPLWVYVPPGYDDQPDRRYPTVHVIQGYGAQVTMWGNRAPFRMSFPEEVDHLFATESAPPAIVVFSDSWTKYGGSQFVDSAGTGQYHSYLCDEIVPWVDAHYRTIPDREHRAIAGKSSGGFGAMITPMLRPDLFAYLATHSGDNLYEMSYLQEVPKAVRALREYDGDIHAWWTDFGTRPPFSKQTDMMLLMFLGISSCFSADADGTPRLPFHPRTGVLDDAVWQRWLDWDPVRMVPTYADALRSMCGIWIDCGTSDEFYLDLGAEAFREALRLNGIADEIVEFELFEATHMNVAHRYPMALRWLCQRMAEPTREPV